MFNVNTPILFVSLKQITLYHFNFMTSWFILVRESYGGHYFLRSGRLIHEERTLDTYILGQPEQAGHYQIDNPFHFMPPSSLST